MNKIFLLMLLLALAAYGQRQRVSVLPSIASPETKLTPAQLNLLTDKVQEYASQTLPTEYFAVLQLDYAKNRLGDRRLFEACKEGTCVGDLIKEIDVDFGARCDVYAIGNQLYLKFELYGTLRTDSIAETISKFTTAVANFEAMLSLLDKEVPEAFKKIIPSDSDPSQIQSGISNIKIGLDGNYLIYFTSKPSGTALTFNGERLSDCPRTPCSAQFPEGELYITYALSRYAPADTMVFIKHDNQTINIKLDPIFMETADADTNIPTYKTKLDKIKYGFSLYNFSFISAPKGIEDISVAASSANVEIFGLLLDIPFSKEVNRIGTMDYYTIWATSSEVSFGMRGYDVEYTERYNTNTLGINENLITISMLLKRSYLRFLPEEDSPKGINYFEGGVLVGIPLEISDGINDDDLDESEVEEILSIVEKNRKKMDYAVVAGVGTNFFANWFFAGLRCGYNFGDFKDKSGGVFGGMRMFFLF